MNSQTPICGADPGQKFQVVVQKGVPYPQNAPPLVPRPNEPIQAQKQRRKEGYLKITGGFYRYWSC